MTLKEQVDKMTDILASFIGYTAVHLPDDVVSKLCELRDAEDDRGIQLLGSQQNRLCPFEVVDVELTDSVFAVSCLVQHFGCGYQH